MRRTGTSAARRIVMWTAGVVLVVSLVAWVVSLWGPSWSIWVGEERVDIFAWGGAAVWKSWGVRPTHVPDPGFRWYGLAAPEWMWPPWPHYLTFPGPRRHWMVPIWPIVLLSAATFGGACLTGRRRRIWARDGLCLSCGYNLTGITSPCPECGREQEPAR